MNSIHRWSRRGGIVKAVLLVALFNLQASATNGLEPICPNMVQPNGLVLTAEGKPDLANSKQSKLWECVALPYGDSTTYPYVAELKELDFVAGTYTCNYRFKDSGDFVTACKYRSDHYKAIRESIRDKLHGTSDANGKVVIEGVASKDTIDFNDLRTNSTIPLPYKMELVEKDFNSYRKALREKEIIYNRETTLSNALIANDLQKTQALAYTHLVEPYYKPNPSTPVRKGKTFSNFLAGLITLDPNFIEGYNPNNGELKIRTEWKVEALNVGGVEDAEEADPTEATPTTPDEVEVGIARKAWYWIESVFSSKTQEEYTQAYQKEEFSKVLYDGGLEMKIYSYADIFEKKLWGFYYLVNERFDIGYNALATSLLMLFGTWFMALGAGREWIRYLINKDNYEGKVSEDHVTKLITVLASVSIFYISFPSALMDDVDVSGATQQNEIRRNHTIAKALIRKTAQTGADTATMFSDLGLSAFLDFVIKKEQIMTVNQIRRTLEQSLDDIYMYDSALELRNECKIYYNTTDAEMFNAIDDSRFTVNTNWKEREYAKERGLTSLNYQVCHKAYKIYAYMPYQLGEAAVKSEKEMNSVDDSMSEAVYLLSNNAIMLEEKLGWFGAFSVPITYFMMKNREMFLSEGVDTDEVKEIAQKYFDATTLDENDQERGSLVLAGMDNVSYAVAKLASVINQGLLHNILPGFSAIQVSTQDYLDKVYDSKLQVLQIKDKEGSEKSLGSIVDFIKKGMKKVKITGAIGGLTSTVLSGIGSALPDATHSFFWHTLIRGGSYAIAIWIWNELFVTIFMISISLLFLVTFVLYFKDLMVHFISSLFMFTWAFTKMGSGSGESKIMEYVRNTIVIVFAKPIMLVFGAYIFIFVYELMMVLYSFGFASVLNNLETTISLMARATRETDIFTSYSTLFAMQTIADLLINLFGLYIGYLMVMRLPDHFTKKIGSSSEDTNFGQSMTESAIQKQEKHSNPMA